MSDVVIVEGDLLQVVNVDAVVNAWNRNIVPWWMLVPSGVSAAIRRGAGVGPFRELRRLGPIPLGGAVTTGAGKLPYRGIIHVAGISMGWRASEASVEKATGAALDEARRQGFESLAFPLIGAGTGGVAPDRVLAVMLRVIEEQGGGLQVVLVRYRPLDSAGAARMT